MSGSDSDNAVAVTGLVNRFGSNTVHEDLNLEVRRGEIMGLVGGSGSGKTVLLRSMLLLHRPHAGEISLLGTPTQSLGRAEEKRLRQRMGVLFQQGALFTGLTVKENVSLPLWEYTPFDAATIDDLAMLKIQLAGFPLDAANRYPSELSGGMVKRAALARALALDPELLFLDEPTAGLDPVSAGAFDELIAKLHKLLGLTVIMVTHDMDALWATTHRVAFLGDRRVLAVEPIDRLTHNEHPLIESYFGGSRTAAWRDR